MRSLKTAMFSVTLIILLMAGMFGYFEFKKITQQQRQNQIYSYINQLEKLDAFLEIQVLKMNSWSFRNYDLINSTNIQYANLLESAPNLPPTLALNVTTLQQQLVKKFDLIEQFKSNNAVLRNSLNYLPEVAEMLLDDIERLEKQQLISRELSNDYKHHIMHIIFKITNRFVRTQASSHQLAIDMSKLPKEVSSQWGNMNLHLNIVIDFRHRNQLLESQLDSVKLDDQLASLNELFSSYLTSIEEGQQREKIWLLSAFIFVIFLVFILFFVIRHYRRQKILLDDEINTDELTGLSNRRSLESKLKYHIQKIKHTDEKLGLFFIDLDGFKEINDTFGHQQGDQLLQKIATNIKSSVRQSDLVFRLGGDEFVVVVPKINAEMAIKIAQGLLKQCTHTITDDDDLVEVSASIGMSIYPDDSRNIDELINFADKAMYQAKRNGKGCLQFYEKIN